VIRSVDVKEKCTKTEKRHHVWCTTRSKWYYCIESTRSPSNNLFTSIYTARYLFDRHGPYNRVIVSYSFVRNACTAGGYVAKSLSVSSNRSTPPVERRTHLCVVSPRNTYKVRVRGSDLKTVAGSGRGRNDDDVPLAKLIRKIYFVLSFPRYGLR